MKPHFLFALLACALTSQARDFYVDPAVGNESANGFTAQRAGADGPVKSIARGLKLAQPGDVVHLAPATYKESAVFFKRVGEPDKPIVLDGHGATLEGSEPIDPATWTETAPGLFRNDQLVPHFDAAILQRWFFLWSGKMNHMGRTSKGHSDPLKKPDDLQPGEWTFVKDDSRKLPDSQQIFGSFYVKLPPGQKLADAQIAIPVRSAGVQLSGDNRHLIIRNLTATHVYNDGFNIHGHCEDVLFENIRAIECGDDGISAHETAEYRVDGFVSIGNSTGICDTVASATSYNRVFIQDCLGYDLYFLDTGRYSVTNSIILSSAWRSLSVSGREQAERPCTLTLENVLVRRVSGTNEVRVAKNSVLKARRTTFENLGFQAVGGDITLESCVLRGAPTSEMVLAKDVQWHGGNNLYALKALRFDQATYTPETFAEFQKLTGQEAGSRLSAPSTEASAPSGLGADVPALEADLRKLRK